MARQQNIFRRALFLSFLTENPQTTAAERYQKDERNQRERRTR
jgi:hypothetical protein